MPSPRHPLGILGNKALQAPSVRAPLHGLAVFELDQGMSSSARTRQQEPGPSRCHGAQQLFAVNPIRAAPPSVDLAGAALSRDVIHPLIIAVVPRALPVR